MWPAIALLIAAFAHAPLRFEPLPNSGEYLVRTGVSQIMVAAGGARFGQSPIQMRFVGATHAKASALDPLPMRTSYLIGNDPGKWRTDVPSYSRVRYTNVYPGVDLLYHGEGDRLEYDFELAAHADPRRLRLRFEGADHISIDRGGNLLVGSLRLNRPVAYQDGHPIEVAFERRGRDFGFRLGRYDRERPLVIDPTLVYSTYFGGSVQDSLGGIAVDGAGNVYVAGTTSSPDFPGVTPPPSSCIHIECVVVAKFNPSGALLYTTYVGGSQDQRGGPLAIDASGDVYITGSTTSPDFPTVAPLQASLYGPRNAFVAKLNPAGSALIYSTYLGGSGTGQIGDGATGIAVDAAGNAYVTGDTQSADFPTVNPLRAYSGQADAFVSKLNAAGSALVYSTFWGGSGIDEAVCIAVDPSGAAYIAGLTYSPDFPVSNTFPPASQGLGGGFVTKFSASGSMVYSTLLSSANLSGIAVDAAGSAYVAGSGSQGFPLVNAIQSQVALHGSAVVAKLAPSGASLVYSTFVGGSYFDSGGGIAVDASGSAYVTGNANSGDFPTVNALQSHNRSTRGLGTSGNAFVSKLNADGQSFAYSTYFGSTGFEAGGTIAVDGSGNAYVAGSTAYDVFPVLNALVPHIPSQGFQGFIAKIADSSTAPCVYSLQPNSVALLGTAVTGEVGMVVNKDTCSWQTAGVVPSWLTITSGASGSGIASIYFSAVANPGLTARTTALTAGGQTFTVTQGVQSHIVTASTSGAPGGLARVPISVAVDESRSLDSVTTNLSVIANGQAPAIAGALGFQADPSVAAPTASATAGTGMITLTWSHLRPYLNNSGITNLGELLVPIPGAFGQTYTVKSLGGTFAFEPTGSAFGVFIAGADSTITVANPQPSITLLAPSSAPPGSAPVTFTVNGEGFTPNSVVLWNGSARPTTSFSESQLHATVTSADLAAAGTAQVSVINTTPGGGQSGTLPFLITPAANPSFSNAGVVEGASYTHNLVGGEIASVFGVNLASSTATAGNLPLPITLGGVTVFIDGIPAPLFYVSPQQINLQLPFRLLNQSQAAVLVNSNGVTSAATTIQVTSVNPVIFTLNSQGTGQGAIQDTTGTIFFAPVNSVPGHQSRPAGAGETAVIFFTGSGAVDVSIADGASPGNVTVHALQKPQVTIGGIIAPASFAGLAPGFVGLYQLNVPIPPGVPSGPAVPVTFTVNGATSNTVTIAIQ